MATASKIGPQDLPPPGGYAPIQTDRIKLRSVIGWKTGLAAFVISNVVGWITYSHDFRTRRRQLIELRSSRMALQPLLAAERDRAFLKQILKNRDEEADLMKDYPGWEVGTYFGEPIFKNLKEDEFVEPQFREFAIHAPIEGAYSLRAFTRLMT